MMLKLIYVQLTLLIVFVASSNIQMILPLGSLSHKNIFAPLAESLAKKGHKVTLISRYASTADSSLLYEDVVASVASEMITKITGEFNVFKLLQNSEIKNINWEVMKIVVKNLPEYCEAFLRDPAVQSTWKSKPDLILIPAPMNECGLILVHKFKVPFIYVTTAGLTPWTSDVVGNPEHPAYVPNLYLSYSSEMTLWQRTVNTIFRVTLPVVRQYFVLESLDSIAQGFFNDSTVSLREVDKEVSLVLVNSHHTLEFPRPLQPNVIEIGGIHCRKAETISDPELSIFLDSSEDNSVIIFSMGSYIKSSQMPTSLQDLLIEAFARVPYKFIWKWEGGPIKDLPSNVLLKSWLPQQDLLGHRAVGAFFTHGGLLSTQEAIYHGVPMLGLPLMADQHKNVGQAVTAGFAIELKFESVTEDEVVSALTRIMEDKSFSQKVMEKSLLMKDLENSPVERATFYTEYVLRHKGAKHLKSAASSLSFLQFILADVIALFAFFVAMFIVGLFIYYKAMLSCYVRV